MIKQNATPDAGAAMLQHVLIWVCSFVAGGATYRGFVTWRRRRVTRNTARARGIRIPFRWRVQDALTGLPGAVRDRWRCLRGRHVLKMDSYGDCARCGRGAQS